MNPLRLLRKLIAVLRGGATPAEVALAVALGVLTGFMPVLSLLTVLLVGAALLLNTSVAVVLVSFGVGKVLSVLLAPVTFGMGKLLLDAPPVEALVRSAANTPFTAWMDLDRYCTLGGMPVGIWIGVVLGLAAADLVRSFRVKMAGLEEGSERFQKWTKKWYVRLVVLVLFGRRKGAKGMTYAEVLEKKTRLVRRSGLIVAPVLVLLLVGTELMFAGTVVRWGLEAALEKVNGATVDIEEVDLGVFRTTLVIKGVHVCNPRDVMRNRFSIAEIRAEFGGVDAMARKLVIDELSVTNIRTDTERTRPGEASPEAELIPWKEHEDSVFQYLKDPKFWKEKLAAYQRYRARKKAEALEELKHTRYRKLRAAHLIRESPMLHIKLVKIAGIKAGVGGMEALYDVELTDLSTDATLIAKDPALRIHTQDKAVTAVLTFSMMDKARPHTIDFEARNVSLGNMQRLLSGKNKMRFEGGTVDFVIRQGKFSPEQLNIPLEVTLSGLQAAGGEEGLLGVKSELAKVAIGALEGKGLQTTLTIRGRPYLPYVEFNLAQLSKSIAEAARGAGEAVYRAFNNRAQEYLQSEVDKGVGKWKKKLKEKGIDPGIVDPFLKGFDPRKLLRGNDGPRGIVPD